MILLEIKENGNLSVEMTKEEVGETTFSWRLEIQSTSEEHSDHPIWIDNDTITIP